MTNNIHFKNYHVIWIFTTITSLHEKNYYTPRKENTLTKHSDSIMSETRTYFVLFLPSWAVLEKSIENRDPIQIPRISKWDRIESTCNVWYPSIERIFVIKFMSHLHVNVSSWDHKEGIRQSQISLTPCVSGISMNSTYHDKDNLSNKTYETFPTISRSFQ